MNYSKIIKFITDGLIALLCGAAIVCSIIGSSIQHADRIEALAAMEVGE